MARAVPEARLQELLACATRVFIEQGYRRTQISDVAEAMGVAKGTVYLGVESKQALFYAALLYADRPVPLVSEIELPLRAPSSEAVGEELRRQLAEAAVPGALERALRRRQIDDTCGELEEIVRELFAAAYRHRTAIKLIDRCGRDHPELAKDFYRGGRFTQLDALARYLDQRIRAGRLPELPDVWVAARFVIEAVATWAVHIHWDPSPQSISPQAAEETLVRIVVRGLSAGAPVRARERRPSSPRRNA
jgi:AcrR family transcriptional regulator